MSATRASAHMYRETEVLTAKGTRLRVIGTTSTSMGLTAAAIATQLIMSYRPRLVLVIGIAAGTRASDKNLRILADPSVDYNSGKVALQNGIREFLPDPYPIGINARLEAWSRDMAIGTTCSPRFAPSGRVDCHSETIDSTSARSGQPTK